MRRLIETSKIPVVLKWKKERYSKIQSKGTGTYQYTTVSPRHNWLVYPTASHPELGYAHKRKGIYWQVVKDGTLFGPTKRTKRSAFDHVSEWVNSYEGEEYDEEVEIINAEGLITQLLEIGYYGRTRSQ